MIKERICIIISDSIFLIDRRTMPFLGPLYVAAALEKNGYTVDVLDLSGQDNWEEVLNTYFNNLDEIIPIALGGTSPQMPMTFKIARFLRANFKNKIEKIILGGTHVSLANAAKKLENRKNIIGRAHKEIEKLQLDFDILVCGEAEVAIFEALKIKKGIVDSDDRNSSSWIKNLDTIERPARHLIDLNSYYYYIDGRRATTYLNMRACPFKCSFCSGRNTSFLRSIRVNNPQTIANELEFLYKTYGYTAFMDFSDEANLPSDFEAYMSALKNVQSKLGVDFRFRAFVKAELFTDQQAKSMYDAGFRVILSGFESGDPRILKNIRKNATREDNTRVVELCYKNNLKIKALMSCNHAGDSYETIDNTRKWLLENKPHFFDLTSICPYMGSPYFDEAVQDSNDKDIWIYTDPKNGDRLYQKTVNYESDVHSYKGIPGEYVSYCWTDYLKPDEVVKLRDEIEAEVRQKLNLPFDTAISSIQYEHSMGSSANVLPDHIFRSTKTHKESEIESKLTPSVEVLNIQTKRKLTVVK
jgi:radical SAM superfamily enzyme YgiQ (UPF0313 family)